MLFLMKLLFGFCLDFLLPKIWITQASNLEITKKNMATLDNYGNTAHVTCGVEVELSMWDKQLEEGKGQR